MSKYPHKNLPLKKSQIDPAEFKKRMVDTPGSKRVPARIVVNSDARRQELVAECDANGWIHNISVDAEADEYLNEIEFLRNRPAPTRVTAQPGRNDPCACGSGKKSKKCCAA
ncbi:MAG: PBPRA1643 family SWIM/SEC-C metal-binding motif protein [Pseudomonadota bacterium]